jgi:hypothetical protein
VDGRDRNDRYNVGAKFRVIEKGYIFFPFPEISMLATALFGIKFLANLVEQYRATKECR